MHSVNTSMFVVLLVLTVGCFLWLRRAHWQKERCWACHVYKPRLAPRCWSCGAWQRRPQQPVLLLASSLLLVSLSSAQAQDVQFLDCSAVRLLTEHCDDEVSVPPVPPPARQSAPPPLFPAQTLARDIPPLFQKVLHTLSLDDARAYVAWTEARLAVTQRAQALVQQAEQERRQRPR